MAAGALPPAGGYGGGVSNYPEPSDVGPAAGGHLRASDADRAKVADVLNTAYADGRLTRDELDERLEHTMRATTFDDLVPLTRDLVPTTGPIASPSPQPRGPLVAAQGAPGTDTVVAVFSGTTRKGRFLARSNISTFILFGGTDIDLREATFESDTIEISVACAFGGVDIYVPEGVNVVNKTVAIFGGADVKNVTPSNGPTVVVKGLVLFGGLDVKGPKPPKGRKK